MEKDWMILQQRGQVEALMAVNEETEKFGLILNKEEAELILRQRHDTLRKQKRMEFGSGITPKILYEFCDSAFIHQDNYVDTIVRLQEIFYLYKNETLDEVTDDELLHFMKEQYENICYGDLDYLEGTCLSIFSQAVRAGHTGHRASDGYGEYAALDEVTRWDDRLYEEALEKLW